MRALIGSGLIALVFGFGVGGCAVTSQDGRRMGLKSDAYADYVERVFQRQSEVSTGITFALDDEDPSSARYQRLEDADLDLLTACGGLNELAREGRGEQRPGGFGALRRARQVPECERAADEAAAVLAE